MDNTDIVAAIALTVALVVAAVARVEACHRQATGTDA